MPPISPLPHATAFAEPFGILMFRDTLRNPRGTFQTKRVSPFVIVSGILETEVYLLV